MTEKVKKPSNIPYSTRRSGWIILAFVIGLAIGAATPVLAAQTAAQKEQAWSLRLLGVVYAITALAVDTEQSAVDIVEIRNRIDRLEVLVAQQRSKTSSGGD